MTTPEEKPAEPAPPRRDIGASPDAVAGPPPPTGGDDFARHVQAYRDRTRRPRPPEARPVPLPERPRSVTAAADILFISAGLTLLTCCGLNLLAGDRPIPLSEQDQTLLWFFNGVIVVGSVLNLVLGYFILQGRRWAQITTIVAAVIGILLDVVSLAVPLQSNAELRGCGRIVLNLVLIGLLSTHHASKYFRSRTSSTAPTRIRRRPPGKVR